MIPCLVPPPAAIASAPLPLETAALDFCRGVATQMGWEAKADPLRMKALRDQAASMLPLCAKALPSDNRALPLLEAALGALESAAGEEAKGEKRFGRAAKTLAQRWRKAQKTWGSGSLQLLPELENLELLYELAGLRPLHWRDEALRIRVSQARVPDLVLEKDLAAVVEDHYGPWLTVVELEPMLEFCHHLARLWTGYRDDPAMTQQVRQLGLKPDAYRVWRLAAKKWAEWPRRELAVVLSRLDVGTLLQEQAKPKGDVNAVLQLAEALKGTALEASAQDLVKRIDSRLCEGNGDPRREPRRRIARIREDWGGWAGLLREDLAESTSLETTFALLDEAAPFLGEHPDENLLAAGTQSLRMAVQTKGAMGPQLSQRLESWASLQSYAGHPEEAEDLLRLRLEWEDAKGQDHPARCELLARLARWKDLEELLGPPLEQESERVLGWRFRVALGRSEGQVANRWVEAWFTRVSGPEAPEEPPLLPGLSRAIPHLQSRPEALGHLVAQYGARLLPGQEALLTRDPWRILAALDPEAPASLLPGKAEEALRWRWNRLPSGEPRRRLLEQLIQEAETQLSSAHVLVAELLLDLGAMQKEEGLVSLERAQGILESLPGHEQLLAKVYLSMAAACSPLDGKGLERNILKAMEVLERTPHQNEEAEDWVREMPSLLLIHLWREQRLEELLALGPRVQALGQRASRPPSHAAEMGAALITLARIARLQSQIRAAGLP